MQPSPYFTRFNNSSYCDVSQQDPGDQSDQLKGKFRRFVKTDSRHSVFRAEPTDSVVSLSPYTSNQDSSLDLGSLASILGRPYLNPAGSSMQKEIIALEWFATWD
ncbi:hypothetical protein BC332_22574 [Capsicum chinense]|nr:hypothetical protein BC332_22574 [Capsicum chinense]